MDVPKPIKATTAPNYEAYRTIDEFFLEIKSEVEKKLPEGPDNFRIGCYRLTEGVDTILDDKVHVLYYRNDVLAVVTETRTAFNNVRFSFFKNLENLTLKNP